MKLRTAVLLLILAFLTCGCESTAQTYDGWQRTSEYIEVRDGTRIAVDYYQPTSNGQPHRARLPVILRFTPYGRHVLDENGVATNDPATPLFGGSTEFLEAGYVYAVADLRGTGASFGTLKGWMDQEDAQDIRDVTDWFGTQSWSNGKVGLTGVSYLGGIQYLALGKASEHLKAIFPAFAQWDHFSSFNQNGVFRGEWRELWSGIRQFVDIPPENAAVGTVSPVDADVDRILLVRAANEHLGNVNGFDLYNSFRYRDAVDTEDGSRPHEEGSAWYQLDRANQSGVAVYHWAGWYDHGAYAQTRAYSSLKLPQKLHIGPYFHRDRFFDITGEQVRWFDYWLKGIDNGIMDEPAVSYYLAGVPPDNGGWRTADSWPLKEETRRKFYFDGQNSHTVESFNDGSLTDRPAMEDGRDDYVVDYSLTLGGYVDQNNGVFRLQCAKKLEVPTECYMNSGYPDLSERYDSKAITYTTAPLAEDIDVVGNPVARFWTSSNKSDAIYFVLLEEVEPEGASHFVSYYSIRGSHHALHEPPYDTMGMPWHGSYESEISPLTDEPQLIELALNPVGNRFDKRNRIRVTIAGADSISGTETEDIDEGRIVTIYHGDKYPSHIELPIISRR